MKRSKRSAKGLAALVFVILICSKNLAISSLAESHITHLTFDNSTLLNTAALEEAYFVLEVMPRKDQFVIKLADPGKIQKARNILAGKDQSTPHVSGVIIKEAACYNPPWSFHLDPQTIEFFASAIEVCDGSIAYTESFLNDAGGAFLPGNQWCPWGSRLLKEISPPDCNNSTTSVSAANYKRVGLTSESIVTGFGNGLAAATEVATTLPLPTQLAGTTVQITDGAGNIRLAPLFFVSPTQINYQIPPNTEPGLATVTITNSLGQTAREQTQLLTIAPGLFTASATGQGVVAAVALRIKANGSQYYEPVARFDQTLNRFVPAPIDLGDASDQLFLVIFGTGLRNARQEDVLAKIGELTAEVAYIGPQPDFTGLDQLNLRLPRRLLGQGEVTIELLVDDQKPNPVLVAIK